MSDRIDGEALRVVMRHVPSPVTVVTVADERRGITIGSFTSASLRPPLISFNVSRDATVYDALTKGDRFAVHILKEEQAYLSDRFATPDISAEEQFDGIDHYVDADGLPILTDALAVLICTRDAVYDAGDHSIIVGRVEALHESGEDELPLVYYDRSYRRVGKEAQPTLFDPVVDDST